MNKKETSAKVRRLPQMVLGALASCLELILSRRGLAVLFLLGVAGLSLGGWIRPPLSPDIRGWHIPIFSSAIDPTIAESLLYGPRQISIFSVGATMLALIFVGLICVIVNPRRFGAVMTVLLVAAIATNAAAAVNHPVLVDLLEEQLGQYSRMASFLTGLEVDVVTDPSDARITATPLLDPRDLGLGRGVVYLHYGKWLIPMCAFGLLFAARGALHRRCLLLAMTATAGIAIGAVFCTSSLIREYRFQRALDYEAAADYHRARESLHTAIASAPILGELERSWALEGRIADHLGEHNPQQQFYEATQLERAQRFTEAIQILSQIDAVGNEPSWAVRRRLARVYASQGLHLFAEGHHVGAADAWERARHITSANFDSTLFAGIVQARLDPNHPEIAEAAFQPILNRMADRLIRADVLATLGDVYFEAGRFVEARAKYQASMKAFNLPKQINYRAQCGLVGM